MVKTTVFLADMNNFAELNRVYGTYFSGVKPARSCVQVARLPLDAQGVLLVALPAALPQTIYGRFGLWIPLLLGLSLVVTGSILGKNRRNF